MTLFALITALLLEQVQPLSSRKHLSVLLSGYVNVFRQRFDAGQQRHGMIAWFLAMLPLIAGAILLYQFLYGLSPILAWAFNVLVLYLTMGFRQFSHYFTDIHQALRDERLDEARRLLSAWLGIPFQEFNSEEVARLSIEQALIASHRYVFGVIVWFVLFGSVGLGGASGALLYRLGQYLRWNMRDEFQEGLPVHTDHAQPEALAEGDWGNGEFGSFARVAFYYLDWLPVRLTALTFAIVGNFEDTIYCWRNQAASWNEQETGILLSSGAGALGVCLGMPILRGGILQERPEIGIGDDADPGFMQSTVGLVWRSVVFWLVLLMLLTFSNFLG